MRFSAPLTLITLAVVNAFTAPPHSFRKRLKSATKTSQLRAHNEHSRSEFLAILGSSAFFAHVASASATDEYDIQACVRSDGGKPNNCVSTKNVKQVDLYAPPWTFEVPADEAFARLKGVIASDATLELVQDDEAARYLRVRAARGLVTDEIEFLINAADQVVTFRSAEVTTGDSGPGISDFGGNRSRLEAIRKTAGVFGVMGEGLTADSYEGDKGQGPLGQLKAFYGLQSGAGFEDVFADD